MRKLKLTTLTKKEADKLQDVAYSMRGRVLDQIKAAHYEGVFRLDANDEVIGGYHHYSDEEVFFDDAIATAAWCGRIGALAGRQLFWGTRKALAALHEAHAIRVAAELAALEAEDAKAAA